jgi:hypothetical protein
MVRTVLTMRKGLRRSESLGMIGPGTIPCWIAPSQARLADQKSLSRFTLNYALQLEAENEDYGHESKGWQR